MKIFNWVHKTFHPSSQKDGFDSKVRKAEAEVMKWDNNEASLKEVALADVHGGWKDGFLSIGTLGCYGSFNCSNQHKDYFTCESDGDESAGEESKYFDCENEEMKPLIQTKFENNYYFEDDDVNEKPNNLADISAANKVEALVMTTPTPTLVSDDDEEVTKECVHVGTDEEEEEEKGERITLADLFLADSEKIMKHDEAAAKAMLLDDDGDDEGDHKIRDDHKQSVKAKHGKPTFAKKLISRVTKDKPQPIKTIRKLMKKMIKKKIHPEFDVKNQKSEGQEPSASEI